MSDYGNICKFSNTGEVYQDLFAFQFIYETLPEQLGNNRSYAAFCCHLVTEGEAVFHTSNGDWALKKGDIFFAFPSLNFTLGLGADFKYLYIAFVGRHASDLLESLGITRETPVCPGYENLLDVWFDAFSKCNTENLSFMAKGLLYHTFALFKQPVPAETKSTEDYNNIVTKIRDAIEQDYANADLSLDYLCALHHYNPKYISRRFTEIMGVSFSDYTTSCRIRHACALLDESRMSIRDIAISVGYRDALYFSKVFKKIMKTSPSEYRQQTAAVRGKDL
ncbi:MAG: helix-turn-helix transcriptional regulator [Roseburia sp.]|nr:helix-turn-helix transcriptional regulator [Roseburia sp.]